MGNCWHQAEGTFRRRNQEVKALCEKHFGPEHKQTFNPVTKRKQDNHGNWQLTFGGVLMFRYKKDLAWFLLSGGAELVDVYATTWPFKTI